MQYNVMWCHSCRQDVPGRLSDTVGVYSCPRCGGVVSAQQTAEEPSSEPAWEPLEGAVPPLSALSSPRSPLVDTWDLDEQLRHVAQTILADYGGRNRVRIDPGHGLRRHTERHRPATRDGHPMTRRLTDLLGFSATWLGVAATTCGGILVSWAELAARAELQTVGLPITIGGVLALALGVTMQVDRAGDNDRSVSRVGRHRVDAKATDPTAGPHTRRRTRRQTGQAA